MRGGTSCSTCLSAWLGLMQSDTSYPAWTTRCPSACLDHMDGDTRCPHVDQHAAVANTATSRASVCQAAWNCFMHIYTFFFC
ncbi:hypothetical protein F2Q68_00010204 [Brassica cretica]|uniref:Uncharacterized protein n=1 Tax=Brassica cretica TaxID=69181 RepID=A0A8S9KV99_BRACR|nr:hypothetical protein F2Q68_00010204 [Brassica cretica]